MLLVTASAAWFCASTLVVAVCRAAAYGDMKLAFDGEQPRMQKRRRSLPAFE